MAKKLLKRTTPEAPKPLPARGKETEPEICLGIGAQIIEPKDRVPMLGFCVQCKAMHSHSQVDRLCLNCHKEAAGFEFDADKMRYIKKGIKKT